MAEDKEIQVSDGVFSTDTGFGNNQDIITENKVDPNETVEKLLNMNGTNDTDSGGEGQNDSLELEEDIFATGDSSDIDLSDQESVVGESVSIPDKDGFNVSSLGIDTDAMPSDRIQFSSTNQPQKIKKDHINYSKISTIVTVLFILALIGMGGTFFYSKYFHASLALNPSEKEQKWIDRYDGMLSFVDKYVKIDNKSHYVADTVIIDSSHQEYLDNELLSNNVDTIVLAEDINYIDKRNLLHVVVDNLYTEILKQDTELVVLKTNLTKYAYYPPEIELALSQDSDINIIEASQLSLESIKFSSAMNVFRYMDTFLSTLSKPLKLSKPDIRKKIDFIISRGEKDINLYMKKCFLNPYEINFDCNIIGDFDKYYDLVINDRGFDKRFFKKLMNHIDIKLEQNSLPSFVIIFQKFDKNNDEIVFDVEINTFRQDEEELSKQGILNPHVFILTNLINNLKQNRFIVGDHIKIDSLDIETKTIEYGLTEFVVNNSSNRFVVPIKTSTQRGIYDFVESYGF